MSDLVTGLGFGVRIVPWLWVSYAQSDMTILSFLLMSNLDRAIVETSNRGNLNS